MQMQKRYGLFAITILLKVVPTAPDLFISSFYLKMKLLPVLFHH